MAAWPLQSALAVEFPIEYSGHYSVTYTTTNAFGSNLCTDQAALTITLLGDGTLSYVFAQMSISVNSPPNQPPTCSMHLTGKTVTMAGTHDLKGSFSVPFGDTAATTLSGTYDDEHIAATYQPIPSWRQTLDLPAVSHRIALEPDPTKGWDFHKSILEGRGFKLVMRDPHGNDHLDFNTLRIIVGGSDTVAGTDTTQHALGRLVQGIVPFREESAGALAKVFRLLPDPRKLMQGHDIFAIPFNGDWRIELRVCDKAQHCFKTVYRDVFFGPFVTVWKAWDLRCEAPSGPFVRLHTITIGNIGIDSPDTALYLGLASLGLGGAWTFHAGDFGDGLGGFAWWQGQILPFLPNLSVPSGTLLQQDLFDVPDWISIASGSGPPFTRKAPFPGGNFRFIAAALDTATGAFRRDEQDVKMCE